MHHGRRRRMSYSRRCMVILWPVGPADGDTVVVVSADGTPNDGDTVVVVPADGTPNDGDTVVVVSTDGTPNDGDTVVPADGNEDVWRGIISRFFLLA